MTNDKNRGTGRTTRQMQSAPDKALFIWRNSQLSYPILLAKKLGRGDLHISPLSVLDGPTLRGREFAGVILDHAASLSEPQANEFEWARDRVRAA